jgi:hypothetical protein
MRYIAFATFVAAALASPAAFAQGDHVHHNFCMKTGSGLECAYDSFQQCQAAVKGANDSCVANSPTQNH